MPKFNFRKTVYRWRVRAGFIGLILAIILAKPNLSSLLGGIGICSLGLLIRTWASGHLKKEKELTISGPYQHTRNPLYLGNFILGISTVLGSRSLWILVIFFAYFLLFYPIAIKSETEKMKRLFPKEYENYKKKVPPFLPFLKPLRSSGNNRFSWALYRKNKEYRALVGAVLFWVLMAGKMLLFL